jgi:hypothetical protein
MRSAVMTGDPQSESGDRSAAAAIASRILDRADRDVAFVACLTGESPDILVRHFRSFIDRQLRDRQISDDTCPLLRPFVDLHARELADFVIKGIGLRHRLGIESFERLEGDPQRLFRVDLWDTLRSHIEHAERHFVSDLGGLKRILAEMQRVPKPPAGGS